jgi:hypothetical protein
MDAYNNYVGRTIQSNLGTNATNNQIADAVKSALDQGRLVISPGGTASPTTGGTGQSPNITIRQYSSNGSEFISYQLIDALGNISTEASYLTQYAVQIINPMVTSSTGKYIPSEITETNNQTIINCGQSYTTPAELIKETTIAIDQSQFNNIITYLANPEPTGGLNTVDFTESLLSSIGPNAVDYLQPSSLSAPEVRHFAPIRRGRVQCRQALVSAFRGIL